MALLEGTSNVGSPPYHESALKAALRYLGYAGIGAGAAQQGAGLGNLFLGAGAGARASQAAQQAAQEYAMKQRQAQEDSDYREYQKRYMEAQTEAMKRPKEPKPPEPWDMDEPTYARHLKYLEDQEKIKNKYKPAGEPKKDRTDILDFNTLSDNFRQDPDVKNYIVVRDNTRRIKGALQQGTGFGDLSAIFAFMRVLDPNSVVRETEFRNAEEASGWLQRVLNLSGKVVSGNRLTPVARQKILAMTNSLSETQKKTYDAKTKLYRAQAERFKVDPKLLIPDYGDSTAAPAGGDPLEGFYAPSH
jgi:hypothetical protein